MGKTKVLLVDDQPVIRQGLRVMLATDEAIEVVGEAASGPEAAERVKDLDVDVVLMDIRMPEGDGIQATRRIKEERPGTVVIMLTAHENDYYLIDALCAGAAGYLLKDASRDLLVHTIRAAPDGGTVVRTPLLQKAIHTVLDGGGGRFSGVQGSLFDLTPRELEVLKLIGAGHTNKEMAAQLSLASDTIKKYVRSIITKLDASDRTHAAVTAARAGLLNGAHP